MDIKEALNQIKKTEGYVVKRYDQPVKRYVQILNIIDDKDKIDQYRQAHSEEGVWPEVLEGIKEVGILEMEIYNLGNTVVMIVETPLDFNWDEAMARLNTLPRQAEWETHVSSLQGCDGNLRSDQKWALMDRIFHLYDKDKDKA